VELSEGSPTSLDHFFDFSRYRSHHSLFPQFASVRNGKASTTRNKEATDCRDRSRRTVSIGRTSNASETVLEESPSQLSEPPRVS
jgi:hypothetical protein